MASIPSLNSPATKLLYTTVRIAAQLQGGQSSVGTGFFFHFVIQDDRCIPVLITNKHVVQGAVKTEFLVHEMGAKTNGQPTPGPRSFTISLPTLQQLWVDHPGDVDLCAMPVAPLLQQAHAVGRDIFYFPLTEDLLPSNGALGNMGALEEVIMVGYPNGLWDSISNFPILRRGITATHPLTDFQGKPQGVADIAAFPGSSGSPVLLFNQGSYATSDGIVLGSRAFLLGVLYAGPRFRADGRLEVVDIPTATVPIVSTDIPLHLGYYIKAKELLTLRQQLFSVFQVGT